ncbi:25S rRNA (adenine645-N1)-methyltransferase [Rhizophlyctis rosea]|uniref:Ribosomal RNA-processing protein 8 n=1 Tax=Rhizophlyctis rosea TaxID=64517 RepID=A0AAD5X3W0_9FUNG|nr:25S rRNA (adenine645-N1)-methyltransferase [Rhizophlyctis rosea]
MKRKRDTQQLSESKSHPSGGLDVGFNSGPSPKKSKHGDTVNGSATTTTEAAQPNRAKNDMKQRLQKILQKQKPKTPVQPKLPKLADTTPPPKPKISTKAASSSAPPTKKEKSAPPSSLTSLQQQMQRKLAGAKFRWINELLYTKQSNEAVKLFSEKPEMFQIYHDGFRSQVESWPANPIDIFIDYLRRKPSSTVVADMGCGEGKIAQTLHKHLQIHSFDLASPNEHVIACDIAKVPLADSSVDVTIFCLSLMGTNFMDFVNEAYRILKPGGELKIAEVISRFPDVDRFVIELQSVGFKFVKKDDTNKMFILFDFVKASSGANSSKNSAKTKSKTNKKKGVESPAAKDSESKTGEALLKPCIYKRR